MNEPSKCSFRSKRWPRESSSRLQEKALKTKQEQEERPKEEVRRQDWRSCCNVLHEGNPGIDEKKTGKKERKEKERKEKEPSKCNSSTQNDEREKARPYCKRLGKEEMERNKKRRKARETLQREQGRRGSRKRRT